MTLLQKGPTVSSRLVQQKICFFEVELFRLRLERVRNWNVVMTYLEWSSTVALTHFVAVGH